MIPHFSINERDLAGETPLARARQFRGAEVVRFLVDEYGAGSASIT